MADMTTIASGTAVSGRIAGDSDLLVEGRVNGTIEIGQTLTVAPGALVTATVQARQVVLEGSFEGEISATERVVLGASARAIANITAPLVEMADGAQLRGELHVGIDAAGQPSATASPSATATRPAAARPAAVTTGRTASAPQRTPSAATATATAAIPAAATATVTTVVEEEPAPQEEAPAPLAEQAEPAQENAPEIEEEVIDELREDYTVKELRDELRRRDLPVSGTKDELIERLLQAQADEESA